MISGQGSAKPRIAALLTSLLVLGLSLPLSLLGAPDSFTLEVSVLSGAEEVYTVAPGQPYTVLVASGDLNITQISVVFAGPQKEGLTGSFEVLWDSTGFHDLGSSPESRLLVEGDCTVSEGEWSFAIALPNHTAAGVWEARASAGDSEGVAGFQVSSVHWDFHIVSQQASGDASPGGTSTSRITLGISCNDDFLLNLSCPGLTAPGGVMIAADMILLDDDPVHPEENETGHDPQSFSDGFLSGPAVTAGVGQEVEVFLVMHIPNPAARGPIQGEVSVEFEPVNQDVQVLIDAYVLLLRLASEELEPTGPAEIEYAADLDTASHASGLVYPLDIKLKQLAVLEEAGVDTIRITPAYDIFLQQFDGKITELDSLVAQMRADGKKLMIADGAAEQYWGSPLSWAAFSDAFIQRVGDLAARYQPDYYVVVKEPMWYLGMDWTGPGGMLSEGTTVEQWVALTGLLCDEVKRVSPSTRTGVAVALPHPQSLYYLVLADKLPNLDFVGVDVYRILHLESVEAVLPQLVKPKWILETWDDNPDDNQGHAWRRTTSAEWIRMMANYAKSRGFEGMATFYNLYLCYDYTWKPSTFSQVRDALDERQESFYALRSVMLDE